MKKYILMLVIAALVTTTAKSADIMNDTICNDIGSSAKSLMAARQTGVPIETVIKKIDAGMKYKALPEEDGTLGVALAGAWAILMKAQTIQAYNYPMLKSELDKKALAESFGESAYKECMQKKSN